MRADLRALTADTLAELTNRGLVKRAVRELERAAPALTGDGDGTVRATFPDGVTTTLPVGGLDKGSCSCGAMGVCRHLVGLVLAYQTVAAPVADAEPVPPAGPGVRLPADSSVPPSPDSATSPASQSPVLAGSSASEPAVSAGLSASQPAVAVDSAPRLPVSASAATPTSWSPGEFTDEQLTERIGERAMTAARRALAAGYVARVRRGRPGDPVPSVELPTATVRFLVPHDLGFARTDAVAGVRDEVLALAVWAFRAADERAAGERAADEHVAGADEQAALDWAAGELDVQVQAGGGPSPTGGAGLGSALTLAETVLREGAIHLGTGLTADIAVARRELEAARMRWPLLAVDDLVAQLEAYRTRSARYRPEALADHIAELVARRRAVTGGGSALRSRVLGTDEAAETPLRRARLDGIGARVSAVGDERVVDVFLAHADSATVLVLRRTYETPDTGPQLAARRVAGTSIGVLAGGAVVTESAARSASRTVRLGTRRLSRTEAMTARGSWQDLPRTLIAADLARLAAELDALPPRPIRARVEAETVRVVPVTEVLSVTYAPGAQRLDAVIADAAGTTAVISAVHASCAPGRLDAMAEALHGPVRYVSGVVRRRGGGVSIDPIGFAVGDTVVVPDLSPAGRATPPDGSAQAPTDALGLALDDALSLLAELAHRGLQHAPATMTTRLKETAARLRALGMSRAAEAVDTLAARFGTDPGGAAVTAWVDAHLRLSLAADLR
ncbi:hypothetical protein [Actinoplanes sp. NPDC020271]|uniref:hypothetical protein n=1 Tax=Actinoplanes sp. NPDC020271 TaxID=3363896 RepID=UPI00379CD65D